MNDVDVCMCLNMQAASDQCAGINVLYLPSSEIRSNSAFLKSRWETALPIATIQKQHIFRCAGPNHLLVGRFASDVLTKIAVREPLDDQNAEDAEEQVNDATPASVLSPVVGDWVLVRYDGLLFPGEVKELGIREVKVSVMVPSGACCYKWPTPEDCIFYDLANVVEMLKPPSIKSARGTYEFLEKW